MNDIPKHHLGVPRTLATARKLGYPVIQVDFEEVRGDFMQLASHGSRPGSLCGIAPTADIRYWKVCYKDEARRCTWVRVPRTDPIDH
ncbi:MAG: hypothetical protein JO000_13135 [Alphaproteobacteria bacterium]|nr:hypothetical protein [Alphaproteobacteria bacterium]